MELHLGDCLEVLRGLPDASMDAVVTDPPAGIGFMGRTWDKPGVLGVSGGVATPSTLDGRNPMCRKCRKHKRGGKGHPPCQCEQPDFDEFERRIQHRELFVGFLAGVMRECLRVLKPGGHALVWGIPRTSHWTATAIEDAGFEIRDVVTHLCGQGFPKSLNVSKAIDAAAGAQREPVGIGHGRTGSLAQPNGGSVLSDDAYQWPGTYTVTAPATEEAKRWDGWGTALKPACEFWILARKPLAGTVAANVLEHGTGALNIAGCRIPTDEVGKPREYEPREDRENWRITGGSNGNGATSPAGRWPANLALSHHPDCNGECVEGCPVKMLDEQSGVLHARGNRRDETQGSTAGQNVYGKYRRIQVPPNPGDGGGASRFFYVAKASRRDRGEGNKHPTVKPNTLMRHLCRLITPPGGTVLDCFMGSGSTGVAAVQEGFGFVGIEREAEYHATARRRIDAALAEREGLLLTP